MLLNRLDDVFQHEPEQGRDRSGLRPVRDALGQRDAARTSASATAVPRRHAILDGVTLDVPAGKVVAIVGRSGSGKTTLARCMAGLLEPTDGTILYDGLDLKTLNYRDLRRQIGFVLQDCYVFADTIARNIAFGEEEPDMERVAWAAEVASAHEFIERLPFGYDTRIGETGLALSGGQRQRIAIARAIYHRPPILIFDEATSSLDAESERAVQHNIDALLEGRTAFVIAHRVSTVQNADLIVVLERGRLVEQGSHDALMQRRGLYYHLASQQLGGARHDGVDGPTRRFSGTSPPLWAARALAWVLLALFAAGALALVLVQVPETVAAPFVLVPERGADPVRTLHDGIVTGVRVTDAQTVEPGAVLFTISSELVGDRAAERAALGASLSGGETAAGQRAAEVREPAPSRRAGASAGFSSA